MRINLPPYYDIFFQFARTTTKCYESSIHIGPCCIYRYILAHSEQFKMVRIISRQDRVEFSVADNIVPLQVIRVNYLGVVGFRDRDCHLAL